MDVDNIAPGLDSRSGRAGCPMRRAPRGQTLYDFYSGPLKQWDTNQQSLRPDSLDPVTRFARRHPGACRQERPAPSEHRWSMGSAAVRHCRSDRSRSIQADATVARATRQRIRYARSGSRRRAVRRPRKHGGPIQRIRSSNAAFPSRSIMRGPMLAQAVNSNFLIGLPCREHFRLDRDWEKPKGASTFVLRMAPRRLTESSPDRTWSSTPDAVNRALATVAVGLGASVKYPSNRGQCG